MSGFGRLFVVGCTTHAHHETLDALVTRRACATVVPYQPCHNFQFLHFELHFCLNNNQLPMRVVTILNSLTQSWGHQMASSDAMIYQNVSMIHSLSFITHQNCHQDCPLPHCQPQAHFLPFHLWSYWPSATPLALEELQLSLAQWGVCCLFLGPCHQHLCHH